MAAIIVARRAAALNVRWDVRSLRSPLTRHGLDSIILAPVSRGMVLMARGGRFLSGLLTGLRGRGSLSLLLAERRALPVQLRPPPTPSLLRIHVAGAVRQPGVVELAADAIVAAALRAAGGAQTGDNLDALNLAGPVEGGPRLV